MGLLVGVPALAGFCGPGRLKSVHQPVPPRFRHFRARLPHPGHQPITVRAKGSVFFAQMALVC